MSIELIRVDDRLIHGQVVIGWGSRLRPDGFLVVDDALSESVWEQELYRMGLERDMSARFVSVGGAGAAMDEVERADERWIVLLPDVRTAWMLARAGDLEGRALNLGGVHAGTDAEPVLPYLQLQPGDREYLAELMELGIEVGARDLPDSALVPLAYLLG